MYLVRVCVCVLSALLHFQPFQGGSPAKLQSHVCQLRLFIYIYIHLF